MRQYEKRKVLVVYCDWCHKEITGGTINGFTGSDSFDRDFHPECSDNYSELIKKRTTKPEEHE